MRIAISGMFWAEPNVGSGQYLHHLVSTLAREPSDHRFVLIIPRYTRVEKPALHGWQVIMMPTPFDGRHRNLAKLWFEQIALAQVCRKLWIDLVHVPYFAAPRRSGRPVVVTIHDLIPLLLPTHRGGRGVQAYMRLAAAGARRADAVIADSEHTRRDIITHLGIPPERVTVTHLAVAPEYGPRDAAEIADVRERFRLRRPYVYYIGGFQAHKNVAMVVRAFAEATQGWDERPQLAIGGQPPDSDSKLFPDVNRMILDAGIAADVAMLGRVSTADNAALMAGCAAFLFPSRYEGFGLPPLEAMQCGAPVIASSTTSVGEVVAGGGLLVDPDDLPGWTTALRRVLMDEHLAADLRRRGIERARQFSWDKTTAETLEVYNSVVSSQ
ncbi:MAG: glycosyltransferase family 4 protein [Chloroflexota bacterium]|nr:glycosyltransferase family 4 protein [Chloroflexota bacterium]